MKFFGGKSSSSTAPAAELMIPPSPSILYQVDFRRYKLGSPVLYMMRVAIMHRQPTLHGPNGEIQEARNVQIASWRIVKRYSEMESLHKYLKTKYSEYMEDRIFPEFPNKQWSNVFYNTEENVKERLRSLQSYFDKILRYPMIAADYELNKLLECSLPETMPHFRVCMFELDGENDGASGNNNSNNDGPPERVVAVCELGPGEAGSSQQLHGAIRNGKEATSSKKKKDGDSNNKPLPRPSLFFHIMVQQIQNIGFGSSSSLFLYEDRLENSGGNQRFNLALGPPGASYDITITSGNYVGKNEDAQLKIRVMAPTVADLQRDAKVPRNSDGSTNKYGGGGQSYKGGPPREYPINQPPLSYNSRAGSRVGGSRAGSSRAGGSSRGGSRAGSVSGHGVRHGTSRNGSRKNSSGNGSDVMVGHGQVKERTKRDNNMPESETSAEVENGGNYHDTTYNGHGNKRGSCPGNDSGKRQKSNDTERNGQLQDSDIYRDGYHLNREQADRHRNEFLGQADDHRRSDGRGAILEGRLDGQVSPYRQSSASSSSGPHVVAGGLPGTSPENMMHFPKENAQQGAHYLQSPPRNSRPGEFLSPGNSGRLHSVGSLLSSESSFVSGKGSFASGGGFPPGGGKNSMIFNKEGGGMGHPNQQGYHHNNNQMTNNRDRSFSDHSSNRGFGVGRHSELSSRGFEVEEYDSDSDVVAS